MTKFTEKTIEIKKIFSGKIISLQVDKVSLPDGKTSYREIVKHPGAVAIIPVMDDGKILFVNQYRKPLERESIEIPAGKMEENEAAEITAIRELEEETDYTTDELTYVTSFYTSPGFANEIIHLYYTNNLRALTETIEGDEDEFVEKVALTLAEAEQYVKEQKICDAKTAYAILYLRLLQD